MHHFKKDQRKPNNFTRVNFQIRVPKVRVVHDEQQLGIMSTDDARRLAQEKGLDLVEIAPQAQPPVCKIMDYGRYKYEQQIKKKDSLRKQREAQIQLKEIRLRPGIAEHDVLTKLAQAKKFLAEGKRVQFNLQFFGKRELSHKEQGFAVINKIISDLAEVGSVERTPKMEGSGIVCLVCPKV